MMKVQVLNARSVAPVRDFVDVRYNTVAEASAFTVYEIEIAKKVVEEVVNKYLPELRSIIEDAKNVKYVEDAEQVEKRFSEHIGRIENELVKKLRNLNATDVKVYTYYVDEALLYYYMYDYCVEDFDDVENIVVEDERCREAEECLGEPEKCTGDFIVKVESGCSYEMIAKSQFLRVVAKRCIRDNYVFVTACSKLVFTRYIFS